MTDETKVQEPIVEEGAPQPQAEGAPAEAAEPEVPEVTKEPPDTDKALREARQEAKEAKRDARKLKGRLKRTDKELRQARQYQQRMPAQAPQGADQQEIDRQKAMAFDQIQAERFKDELCARLGLERDDERLDEFSPETYMASAAVAKEEDFQEREAELADKEKALEGLGDKLRAETKAKIEETIRDIRRESGLDAVAKPTPASEGATSEADIRAKYKPQFDALKGKRSTGEVMVLIREMEAEIEEARSK